MFIVEFMVSNAFFLATFSQISRKNRSMSGYNPVIFDPYLGVMDFLNEIAARHPEAMSLAAGRPDAAFFDVEGLLSAIHEFAPQPEALAQLGHYSTTRGIIREDIRLLLANDEGIACAAEDIVVTVGSQEAMAIICNTLFERGKDVLLSGDPAYIGMPGYAAVYGLQCRAVALGQDGLDLDDLERQIASVLAEGKRPRAVYDVPDFHNPTGSTMPLDKRRKFIQLAEKHDFLIIEDNPYGMFRYEGEAIPSLKSLDENRRVLYLGSFSKTIFPALRLGFIVAGQMVAGPNGDFPLSEAFSKVKSLVSTNTSTLIQGMVGGLLRSSGHSLRGRMAAKLPAYRAKRDAMLEVLEQKLGGREDIAWNKPEGGFFLAMKLPFEVGAAELEDCVANFGVIFLPMTFFSFQNACRKELRLAFSPLDEAGIRLATEKFCAWVLSRLL
jgi:(S)-3,5-dihydroxyphenylglycine transaminase